GESPLSVVSVIYKQTRLTFSQFFIAQAIHCNTHMLYMEATQDTHTHTHADEFAGEICLLPLTHPEVLVLPQGSQEQWAAFYGARGPGQVFSPILVRDTTGERSLSVCMCLC